LLLIGTWWLATAAMPLIGALVGPPLRLFVSGMTAGAVVHFAKNLIVFVAAGALLCAVIESKRRLRWALALGLIPIASYVYLMIGPGRAMGLNAAGVMFFGLDDLVSLPAAGIGYLVDRRRRGAANQ
jgi:hypothetical protein